MSAAARTVFTYSVSAAYVAYCYQVALATLQDGVREVFAFFLRKMKVGSQDYLRRADEEAVRRVTGGTSAKS